MKLEQAVKMPVIVQELPNLHLGMWDSNGCYVAS